uniref:5-formyltetrahydrofolate cyclo-ligase n=1 Tax=Aplanochytrium stocchinoi TaxID=215587 RepID=A0A7S3LPY1_9STRA
MNSIEQGEKAMKKAVRKSTSKIVSALSAEAIAEQSTRLAQHASGLKVLQASKNVSLYLSMKKELQTDSLLKWLFDNNKRVFIPKVTGKASQDMIMPELRSLEEIKLMKETKWGIPEFTESQLENRSDGIETGEIDFVLAPGVGFNHQCLRLGHGGGYYDCFLTRLQEKRKTLGLPPAFVLVSLNFC